MFKYIFSKIILKIQIPSIKNSKIMMTSKIGSKSNIIKSSIADYSYIGKSCTIVNTEIGKYCSIASYCSIGGENHPIDWISTSPIFYSNDNVFKIKICKNEFKEDKKVIIGNDVWIGEKVFIKAGIEIGDGAVIGAHSVVTRNIKPFEVVGGVPAKFIKYRFDEEMIKKLMKLRWWEMDIKKIRNRADNFEDIDKFLVEMEGDRG